MSRDLVHEEVVGRIRSRFEEVTDFDDLVQAWTDLCERAQRDPLNEALSFAEVEKAAVAALTGQPNRETKNNFGNEISRRLNVFTYPAYLVTSDGYIAASNVAAGREFCLDEGDTIDLLPCLRESPETISLLIKEKISRNKDEPDSELLFKRAPTSETGQETTLAISTSNRQVPGALVFVLSAKRKPSSVVLIQKQFGLTRAEAEILISFVNGYSTQEIARLRNRSHQTVRAQFQTLREKMGVKNQTELLRAALSISAFVSEVDEITNALEHPYRQKTENVRKGGRLVEATMMGNFSGDPIVTIAATNQYTFNAEFEQELFNANILLISVCPPGYGKTEPEETGNSWKDQIRSDVCALLDQLSIERCGLLITFTNAPCSYHLAKSIPSRISHIVQLSTCGPAAYDAPKQGRSAWVNGIIRTGLNRTALKTVLLKGAMQAWLTLGAKQFLRLQMSANKIDAKFALKDENVAESEYALKNASCRGASYPLNEMELVFGDWTSDIEASPQPVILLHGSENALFSIESVRSLVARFPNKMYLIEVKNAGFTLTQSHPRKIVELLRWSLDRYGFSENAQSNSITG